MGYFKNIVETELDNSESDLDSDQNEEFCFSPPHPCRTSNLILPISSDEKLSDPNFETQASSASLSDDDEASVGSIIAYKTDCEENLINFLDASSLLFEDVVIWESQFPERKAKAVAKDESDEEPDIIDYITHQRTMRDEGENVTGETVYKDGKTGRMRNLHTDSVSITLYNAESDYDDDFGKSHVFHPIMTMKEKLMLGLIPNPGWRNQKSVPGNPKSRKKAVGKQILKETKADLATSSSTQQRGILEITEVKIVAKDHESQDQPKTYNKRPLEIHGDSEDVDANQTPFTVPDAGSITKVQKCFKQILLQALPSCPSFEIKVEPGRKEYKFTSLKDCISEDERMNLVHKPKMTNLVEQMSSSSFSQSNIKKVPSTPDRVRESWESPTEIIKSNQNQVIPSGDMFTSVIELEDFKSDTDFSIQDGTSYTNIITNIADGIGDHINQSEGFYNVPKKIHERPFYSARYRYPERRPRPIPRATNSHRNYATHEIKREQSLKSSSKHVLNLERRQSRKSQFSNSSDTRDSVVQYPPTQFLQEIPAFRSKPFKDGSSFIGNRMDCFTTQDSCNASGGNHSAESSDSEEVSDSRLSMIFNRPCRTSASSSSSYTYKSPRDGETSSSLSSEIVQRDKKLSMGEWKLNPELNFRTSVSIKIRKNNEDYRNTIPQSTASGSDPSENNFQTGTDFKENDFVETILYDFSLDNHGSSVAISVTLPYHIPIDRLPYDSPRCAYSILDKAKKMLKTACPKECSSSQSDEKVNTKTSLLPIPMRCFVDIEEIFSEYQFSNTSESRKFSNESKIIQESRNKKSPERLSCITSVPQMLDKGLQTSQVVCSRVDSVREENPWNTGRKKCLKGLSFLLSCGCFRRSIRISPYEYD